MKGILRRVAIGLATGAVALGALALPASADVKGQTGDGPILIVQNPSSGDVIPRSKQYFFGIAYDPKAKSGSGVDRVMVYSGARDAGGFWLGTALSKADAAKYMSGLSNLLNPDLIRGNLGLLNVSAIGTQWANSVYRVKTVTLTRQRTGSLYFYARSSVSGHETVVVIDNITVDPGRAAASKP